MMNCGVATVAKSVHRVCRAICEVFQNFVPFPNTLEALRANAAGFYKRAVKYGGHGIAQIVGAIDGTHIAIKFWRKEGPGLFNRKTFTSINVSAICDHMGRFIDVFTGNAGSVHDSTVMQSSPFWRELSGGLGKLFWRGRSLINGVQVPFQIIADSAYPCKTFVLPALKDSIAATRADKKRFNKKHATTRNVVERAFGRLKARWRVLLRQNELSMEHVNHIIMACFCLHNICEVRNERCPSIDAELVRLLAEYNSLFEFEQQGAGRNVAGINIQVDDDVDMEGYDDVAMPDPSQDVPLPNNTGLHGNMARDALIGLASQR